jgi:hypothetical protein
MLRRWEAPISLGGSFGVSINGMLSWEVFPTEPTRRRERPEKSVSDQRMLSFAFFSERRRTGGTVAKRRGHPPPLAYRNSTLR